MYRSHPEWNHNPDTSRFTVGNGLRLQTATMANGETMANGDRSGLAMLRQSSAWIGVVKANNATRVVMTDGLTMNSSWATTGTGVERASANISGGRIWLWARADIQPGAGRQATFSYSADGVNFTPLGPAFTLNNEWQFFTGYRFGIFNYATQALGGAVTVRRFDLTAP